MTVEKRPFYLDFAFKAMESASDDSLHLRGYAAAFSTDRDREVIQRAAAEAAVESYMHNPALLLNHDITKPIGKILSAVVDDFGIMVEAVVPRPVQDWAMEAYNKIRDGIYKAFSVGGLFGYQGKSVVQMDWAETSVVAVPAHPHALFEVVTKSFDIRAETSGGLFSQLDGGGDSGGASGTVSDMSSAQFATVMERVGALRTKAAVFVEATEQQGVRVQTAKAMQLRKKAQVLTETASRLESTLQRMRAGMGGAPASDAPAGAPAATAAPGAPISPLRSPLGHAHGDVYKKPVPRSAAGLVQIMGEPPGTYCKGGTKIGWDNDLRRAAVAAGYTSEVAKKIRSETEKRLGKRPADITKEHIQNQRSFGEV